MQTQTDTEASQPKKLDLTNAAIDVSTLPTMAEVEKQYLTMILEKTGGNKVKTAQILGLTVKTIYNKLNSYKSNEVGRTSP